MTEYIFKLLKSFLKKFKLEGVIFVKSVQSRSVSAPEVYSVKEKKVFLVKYQNLFLAIFF